MSRTLFPPPPPPPRQTPTSLLSLVWNLRAVLLLPSPVVSLSCHFFAGGASSGLFGVILLSVQIVFNSFGQEDGALVEQLGDDRWSNVCAAFCHITTLVLIAFLHSFYFILFFYKK